MFGLFCLVRIMLVVVRMLCVRLVTLTLFVVVGEWLRLGRLMFIMLSWPVSCCVVLVYNVRIVALSDGLMTSSGCVVLLGDWLFRWAAISAGATGRFPSLFGGGWFRWRRASAGYGVRVPKAVWWLCVVGYWWFNVGLVVIDRVLARLVSILGLYLMLRNDVC